MADVKSVRISDFYYDAIVRRLMQLKRIWMPWHTEENPEDPINGLIRLFAWLVHRGDVQFDVAASERFWLTLQQRASAVDLAALNGYVLSADTPARSHVLAKLTGVPSSFPWTAVQAGAEFATQGDDTEAGVVFEVDDSVVVAGTSLDVYTDPSDHAVYVGHRSLQFTSVVFSAAGYAVGATFAVEFWNADYDSGTGILGAWQPLPAAAGLSDGTANLAHTGGVTWTVRELHRSARWDRTTVNGIEAYWIRFRPTVSGSAWPTTPAFVQSGSWYVHCAVTQGRTMQETLGTTTTDAWQSWRLGTSSYIEGSLSEVLFGTDTTWTKVDSFLFAGAADKVYRLVERVDGYYVVTGDGVTGVRPPDGVTVQATYREGASTDGNAGEEQIVVNRSGTPRLDDILNPRAATGWAAAECSTAESLARFRELAPATLRALDRAVSLEDHETLAVRWRSSDGRLPFERAYAAQGGSKTVTVYCVGRAGAVPATDDLAAIQIYFNGERQGTQSRGGHGMHNATAACRAYTPKTVNVVATIRVIKRFASGAQVAAEDALDMLLDPAAIDSTTGEWAWQSGRTYSADTPKAAISAVVNGLLGYTTFTVNGVPNGTIALADGEFPVRGTITVNVVEV